MSRRFDERADYEADRFADRPVSTGIRWGVGIIIVVFVLAAIVVPLSLALNWFGAAAKVVGPENVQKQYHAVIKDWNALEAAAANACGAEDTEGSRQGPTLLEDPALAYKAKYREIAIDYNTRLENIFEAGLVGPKGYEMPAPGLVEMQTRVC